MPYRLVNSAPNWGEIKGEKVRVYRNLHTRWMTLQTCSQKGWRVAGCSQSLWLKDCKLIVNLSKYRWIQEHGKRTVCAFVEGILEGESIPSLDLASIPLGYNPLIRPDFYDKFTGYPLHDFCSVFAVVDNEAFVSSDATTVTTYDLSSCNRSSELV